jgi:hypothetical protein
MHRQISGHSGSVTGFRVLIRVIRGPFSKIPGIMPNLLPVTPFIVFLSSARVSAAIQRWVPSYTPLPDHCRTSRYSKTRRHNRDEHNVETSTRIDGLRWHCCTLQRRTPAGPSQRRSGGGGAKATPGLTQPKVDEGVRRQSTVNVARIHIDIAQQPSHRTARRTTSTIVQTRVEGGRKASPPEAT